MDLREKSDLPKNQSRSTKKPNQISLSRSPSFPYFVTFRPCVYIPVQNSEEEVRVVLDQLPREATDIIDILKAKQASLDLWLIIAREYFKQGKLEQFRQILEEGSSSKIDEYYSDVRYERIAILNALGAYYTYLRKIETKQREKEEHFILATQFYNKASRIDIHEPSTWVGKGVDTPEPPYAVIHLTEDLITTYLELLIRS